MRTVTKAKLDKPKGNERDIMKLSEADVVGQIGSKMRAEQRFMLLNVARIRSYSSLDDETVSSPLGLFAAVL